LSIHFNVTKPMKVNYAAAPTDAIFNVLPDNIRGMIMVITS